MIPKHLGQRLVLPAAAVYGVFLLCVPQAAAKGFTEGLVLCTESLLPTLFPFFVVSSLILHAPGNEFLAKPLAPLTRQCGIQCRQAPMILLLSWVGGYAVCARLIGDALNQKTLSHRQAQILLILGCCSSPGFVIGSVGGLMLGNVRLGVLLYFLQLAANLLSAAVLWGMLHPASANSGTCERKANTEHSLSLPKAISDAVDSCLSVCGCVLFFRVGASVISTLFSEKPALFAIVCGVLEITSGCDTFAQLGGATALYGICCCLSGLGASVYAQIRYLGGKDLPVRVFFLSRLCNAVFLCAGVRLCTLVLPGTAPVFTSLSQRVIVTSRLSWDTVIVLFAFLFSALYKLHRKNYNCK